MKKLNKLVAIIVTAIILVSCVPTMTVSAAKTATADIPVKVSVAGTTGGVTETLTYELKADDADNPMPAGSVNGVKNIQISGAGESSFGKMEYNRVGIYTYHIRQISGTNPLCTYDNTVYILTVSVINNDGGLLAIPFMTRSSGGYKWEKAEFTNQYSSASGGLMVVKSVNRGSISIGEQLIYTLTVSNTGTTEQIGVIIRDYIPKYTQYVSVNDTYGAFGSIGDKNHVTWFIPSVAPGESVVLSFTVSVDESLPSGETVNNTALYEVTGNPTPVPTNTPSDPSTPTNEVETPQPDVPPPTGDTSDIPRYLILSVAAFIGLILCLLAKNHLDRLKRKEEE